MERRDTFGRARQGRREYDYYGDDGWDYPTRPTFDRDARPKGRYRRPRNMEGSWMSFDVDVSVHTVRTPMAEFEEHYSHTSSSDLQKLDVLAAIHYTTEEDVRVELKTLPAAETGIDMVAGSTLDEKPRRLFGMFHRKGVEEEQKAPVTTANNTASSEVASASIPKDSPGLDDGEMQWLHLQDDAMNIASLSRLVQASRAIQSKEMLLAETLIARLRNNYEDLHGNLAIPPGTVLRHCEKKRYGDLGSTDLAVTFVCSSYFCIGDDVQSHSRSTRSSSSGLLQEAYPEEATLGRERNQIFAKYGDRSKGSQVRVARLWILMFSKVLLSISEESLKEHMSPLFRESITPCESRKPMLAKVTDAENPTRVGYFEMNPWPSFYNLQELVKQHFFGDSENVDFYMRFADDESVNSTSWPERMRAETHAIVQLVLLEASYEQARDQDSSRRWVDQSRPPIEVRRRGRSPPFPPPPPPPYPLPRRRSRNRAEIGRIDYQQLRRRGRSRSREIASAYDQVVVSRPRQGPDTRSWDETKANKPSVRFTLPPHIQHQMSAPGLVHNSAVNDMIANGPPLYDQSVSRSRESPSTATKALPWEDTIRPTANSDSAAVVPLLHGSDSETDSDSREQDRGRRRSSPRTKDYNSDELGDHERKQYSPTYRESTDIRKADIARNGYVSGGLPGHRPSFQQKLITWYPFETGQDETEPPEASGQRRLSNSNSLQSTGPIAEAEQLEALVDIAEIDGNHDELLYDGVDSDWAIRPVRPRNVSVQDPKIDSRSETALNIYANEDEHSNAQLNDAPEVQQTSGADVEDPPLSNASAADEPSLKISLSSVDLSRQLSPIHGGKDAIEAPKRRLTGLTDTETIPARSEYTVRPWVGRRPRSRRGSHDAVYPRTSDDPFLRRRGSSSEEARNYSSRSPLGPRRVSRDTLSSETSISSTSTDSFEASEAPTGMPPCFTWALRNQRDDDNETRLFDHILRDVDDQLITKIRRAYKGCPVLSLQDLQHDNELILSRGDSSEKDDIFAQRQVVERFQSMIQRPAEDIQADLRLYENRIFRQTSEIVAGFLPVAYNAEAMQKIWGALSLAFKSLRREAETTSDHSQWIVRSLKECEDIASRQTPVDLNSLRECRCRFQVFATLELAVRHISLTHCKSRVSPSLLKQFLQKTSRGQFLTTILMLEELSSFMRRYRGLLFRTMTGVSSADNDTLANLALPRSLVTSFGSYVATFAHLAKTLGQAHRLSKKADDETFNKIQSSSYELESAYSDALQSIQVAQSDVILISRAQARMNVVQVNKVNLEFLAAGLITNIQAKVAGQDVDIIELYERCFQKLQYRANSNARKKLLLDIHQFIEEVSAVEKCLRGSIALFTDFGRAIDPYSFRTTTEERFQQYRLENNHLDEKSLSLERRAVHALRLQDRARILAEQVKQTVEVLEEDHGKAIVTFTTITTIFLPLSFVSSVFGINTSDVRNMDGTQWLFWASAIPFTVLVMAVTLVFAYRGSDMYEQWQEVLIWWSKERPRVVVKQNRALRLHVPVIEKMLSKRRQRQRRRTNTAGTMGTLEMGVKD